MEEIYSTIYTSRDLLLFYKEIDQFIDTLFKTDADWQKTSYQILGEEKKHAIEKYLTENKVNLNNPIAVKESLNKIKKAGESFPRVSLTLAFEPTEKILRDISVFFVKRLGHKVIIDVSYERSFIAGALVSFGGKYKDYSLREKIDSYFEK